MNQAAQPNPEYPVGKPLTLDAQEKILARRERSVEMRARGYSFEEIRLKEGVSWRTSYNDVQHHLEHCARYYSAARNREQIARTYLSTQREAETILDSVREDESLEAKGVRLNCLLTIQKAASGLARLYGFVGEKSFFLNLPGATMGEALTSKNQEWIKDLDPERAQELREKIIDFYKARYEPAPIPAEFTVDEPEVAPPKPSVENGHANGNDDGPISMKGG
jgi:hypothetical protein